MAKLTDVRDTPEIANGAKVIAVPVKGGTTIYQGALVALDASGYAIPGKKAESLTAVGRAEETVTNTGADGELVIRVARGVFVFDNTATAANKITAAHVLKPCYMEDDHTVTALATGASVAGTVIRVDDEGVAVECGGYIPAAAAASVGGMIPLLQMQLGEVIFGGVGAGFYGMALFVLLTVFICGLMIGRSPEYLGKKIESGEMKLVALALLIPPALVLLGTALTLLLEAGRTGIFNPGAHGFSEVLYAFSSAANNNGSAFAGLSANSPYYNGMLALAMLLGRFGVILPVLALAGSLAGKLRQAEHPGSLPTHGLLFIGLLVGTVLLVGALTFIPSLALGPIVEQLMMLK